MIDALAPGQRMLDALVGHFTDRGWDLPARRYLSAGNPLNVAADDEHLMIGLDRLIPGSTDVSPRAGGWPSRGIGSVSIPRANYLVRLMWCVTGSNEDALIPAAEHLHADAQRLLRDPGRLLDALYTWREQEPLATSPNALVTIGQIDTVGPTGYLAGCAATVTIAPVQ